MIKLERSPVPAYLSPARVVELTKRFKAAKESVWNHEQIKSALLHSSYQKCAYCECLLDEECKYMEVEHFRDKDTYPDFVVEWINLLPACKRCNGSKGSHDVVGQPIINPYDGIPSVHLGIRAYRLQAITGVAYNTIDVLDLNNSIRVVAKRFEVGEIIIDGLERASAKFEVWEQDKTVRKKNSLIREVEAVLMECQISSAYSATAASVLHTEWLYEILRVSMNKNGLWTSVLEELHVSSKSLVLQSI